MYWHFSRRRTKFYMRTKWQTSTQPPWGPPSLPSNGYQGLFPWGYSGRGAKLTTHLHLVPKSKNAWSYTSTPQYAFMAWCLVKNKDNFTFTLAYTQLSSVANILHVIQRRCIICEVHLASNVMRERSHSVTCKDCCGSSRGLFKDSIPSFTWRNWGKLRTHLRQDSRCHSFYFLRQFQLQQQITEQSA
jgi:hypothetical protein